MDERYYSLDPDVDPQPYQVARSLMIEDREQFGLPLF